MSARIESKYPGEKYDYKVVKWECVICGATSEADYSEGSTELRWYQDKPCAECEDMQRMSPVVFDFVKRVVEHRLAALENRAHERPQRFEIDAGQRALTVRDEHGKLVAMYELLPHPRDALVREQEASDQRLYKAAHEFLHGSKG